MEAGELQPLAEQGQDPASFLYGKQGSKALNLAAVAGPETS